MKRSTLALATFLALVPLAVQAAPPSLEDGARSEDRIAQKVDRLTEHLGLDGSQADAITAQLEASQEDVRALRTSVKETVEGLREAREAGDDKAMRKGLKELDALEEEMRTTKLATRDAIRAELTVEQQVEFALAEIRRHGERHERPSRDRRGSFGERERFRGE